MKRHLRFGLPALLVTAATAVAAQSYPPPQPPYDPGPGAYDDQGDPNQDPYYYDDQAPDGSYPDQGYPDQGYQNQGYQNQGAYPDSYDNQGPVDESLFYSELSPYGRWMQRGSYGWVWEPTRVPVGWRPYTQGRWVNTDYGWTWVSQEPWGWATYHYGRWLLDREYGWLWVPGTEWGPAWVSFQQGDGYIGWAPLPPSVGFRAGFGIQIGSLRLGVDIDPYAYSFVPEREFLRDRVASVILPPASNVTFVRRTRNITDIAVVNNRIVNRSVPVQRIEQVTGQRVRHFRLNETRRPVGGRTEQVQGDQISLFRPAVTLAQPRPNTTPTEVIQRRRQRMQQMGQQAQPAQPGQPVPSQSQQQWRQQRQQSRPAPSAADLERKYQTEQQQLQARQQAERSRLQQMRQSEASGQQAQRRAQDLAAQRQAEERALQEQHQREQQLLQARHQREQQAAQARPQQRQNPQPQNQPQRETKQRREREQQRAREEAEQQKPPV